MTLRINGKAIDAVNFAYDDCHKFYLCRTEADRQTMLGRGFTHEDFYPVSELPAKWAESCPLRFISSADLDTQYVEQCKIAYVTYDVREQDEDEPEGPFTARLLGPLTDDEPEGIDTNVEELKKYLDAHPDMRIEGVDAVADNDAQASFGLTAFIAYVGCVGEDELATTMSDLLGCLRHTCDALGIDFDDANGRGEYHYECEINQAGI